MPVFIHRLGVGNSVLSSSVLSLIINTALNGELIICIVSSLYNYRCKELTHN